MTELPLVKGNFTVRYEQNKKLFEELYFDTRTSDPNMEGEQCHEDEHYLREFIFNVKHVNLRDSEGCLPIKQTLLSPPLLNQASLVHLSRNKVLYFCPVLTVQ